jgi:GDP-L-fucose synthase
VPEIDLNARIYVAGHRGMVGGAIVRALQAKGYTNLVTRTHAELDLTNQAAVRAFFRSERIDQVYLAAAKVGGIHANSTYPAEFIYQNLAIQNNVIHEARQFDVKKLLFLAPVASTRAIARNRLRKNICSLAPWSQPTNPMPSPRSPA